MPETREARCPANYEQYISQLSVQTGNVIYAARTESRMVIDNSLDGMLMAAKKSQSVLHYTIAYPDGTMERLVHTDE